MAIPLLIGLLAQSSGTVRSAGANAARTLKAQDKIANNAAAQIAKDLKGIKVTGTVDFQVHDLGAAALTKQLRLLDNSSVVVGFPEGAQYKGEEPLKDNLGLAGVAIVQELGSVRNGIPSRPANRMTYDNNLGSIIGQTKILDNKVQAGMSAEQSLKLLGVWYEAKLKLGYMKGPFTPNKQSTIDAKGSSRPLHDTGGLTNSITSKVEMGRSGRFFI